MGTALVTRWMTQLVNGLIAPGDVDTRACVALAEQRTRLWQIGSPVARCVVACADAALSGAGCTRLVRPGRPQSRVLPFMTRQIARHRQISSGAASLIVWPGFVRRELPPPCLTADGGSVATVYWQASARDSVLMRARWDLAPCIKAALAISTILRRSSKWLSESRVSMFFGWQ